MRNPSSILPAILPIDVIERWALCHHLGCVVTCLSRARQANGVCGQGEPLLGALKKAEWYLARELSRSQPCPFVPMGPQPFSTEAVLDDWDLSFHLSETLFHIKASKSPSMRGESLKQAMRHLKAEIALVEQRLSGTPLAQTGDQ